MSETDLPRKDELEMEASGVVTKRSRRVAVELL